MKAAALICVSIWLAGAIITLSIFMLDALKVGQLLDEDADEDEHDPSRY
jgi:hypothetical protein